MKFNLNKPKLGDKKTEERYLFFPVTIGVETRWFEHVKIEYTFLCPNPNEQRHKAPHWIWENMSASPNVWHDPNYKYEWIPTRFVDTE